MKGTGLAYTLLCALLMTACAHTAVLQEEPSVLKRYAGYADYADNAGYADNADYAADYAEAQSSETTTPFSIKVSLAGGGSYGFGTGGATYIRWGRTTCPDAKGTQLVYAGTAAGTYALHKGGTNDILCLPDQPEYLAFQGGVQYYSPIMGTEYHSHSQIFRTLHDWNVPCAVCRSTTRGSMIRIPARLSCPNTWTLEYSGYLMSGHQNYRRISAECVDKDAKGIPGSAKNTDGALFYFMEATCNGIKCPPYIAEKELTCAVCTK